MRDRVRVLTASCRNQNVEPEANENGSVTWFTEENCLRIGREVTPWRERSPCNPRGPSAALVDRDAFLLALEQRDLAVIWVIAGEKSAYGGPSAAMGFGGRLNHTAIYRLGGDGFSRCYHQEWDDPDQDQLETMFRPDKVPPGVTTKTRS